MTAMGRLAITSTAKDLSESKLNAFMKASFCEASLFGGVLGKDNQYNAYNIEMIPDTFKVSPKRDVASTTSVPTKNGGKT